MAKAKKVDESKPVKVKKAPASNAPVGETPKAKEKSIMVSGCEVRVSGEYVHGVRGKEAYDIVVKIPRVASYMMYLQEAAYNALYKKDVNVKGVITYYPDDFKKCEVEIGFLGKNVFDLTRDELFDVKCYYGLRGVKTMSDKRAAQILIYKQLATLLDYETPQDEKLIRSWRPIVLRLLDKSQSDTIVSQRMPKDTDKNKKPIDFIESGEIWLKRVCL